MWEATSFQLERLQAAEECVEAEQAGLAGRAAPRWQLSFAPQWTPQDKMTATGEALSLQGCGLALGTIGGDSGLAAQKRRGAVHCLAGPGRPAAAHAHTNICDC